MDLSHWNESEFELEPISELEMEESQMEVIEGAAESPVDSSDRDEREDHRSEAFESQAAADAAIALGDYEAAAYHKELAEDAASLAEEGQILDGPSSLELQVADEHQDHAKELEAEQSEMAKKGDYESARELASEAAYEIRDSDQLAGGSDHSGQALQEESNMDWADWHQQISNDMLKSATDYADQGNFGAAENHLQNAQSHNAAADHYGDLGEHGGALAATDPAPPIESHPYETYSSTPTTSVVSSQPSSSSSDLSLTDDSTP